MQEQSEDLVDTSRGAGQTTAAATGHPRLARLAWLLPICLMVLIVAVLAGRWGYSAIENRHWPDRITVNGRDYDNPSPVSASVVHQVDQGWQQLATVGPGDYPVYGPVAPGQVPTVVWVQTSSDTYEQYELMGGP